MLSIFAFRRQTAQNRTTKTAVNYCFAQPTYGTTLHKTVVNATLTLKFERIRSGVTLFGMTTMSCWIQYFISTCAVPFECRLAISTTTSSSSNGIGSKFLLKKTDNRYYPIMPIIHKTGFLYLHASLLIQLLPAW